MSAMRLALPLLAPLLAGCVSVPASWVPVDDTATVGIDVADDAACWTANVGMATQQGCGDISWTVTDALGVFSSNVQKSDDKRVAVTIYVYDDGQTLAESTTDAAYGVAQVVVPPRR